MHCVHGALCISKQCLEMSRSGRLRSRSYSTIDHWSNRSVSKERKNIVCSINSTSRIPPKAPRTLRGIDNGRSVWSPVTWECGKVQKTWTRKISHMILVHHTSTKWKFCIIRKFTAKHLKKTEIRQKVFSKSWVAPVVIYHNQQRDARAAFGKILPTEFVDYNTNSLK